MTSLYGLSDKQILLTMHFITSIKIELRRKTITASFKTFSAGNKTSTVTGPKEWTRLAVSTSSSRCSPGMKRPISSLSTLIHR